MPRNYCDKCVLRLLNKLQTSHVSEKIEKLFYRTSLSHPEKDKEMFAGRARGSIGNSALPKNKIKQKIRCSTPKDRKKNH